MQDIGRQSGVAFTSLTPAVPVAMGAVTGTAATAPGALTPGQLAAIEIEMVVTGSYAEITKYMNELETSSRYTLVSGYTIADEEVAANPSADTGTSQELTATVNARIFLAPDGALAAESGAEGLTSTPAVTPAPTSAPNS